MPGGRGQRRRDVARLPAGARRPDEDLDDAADDGSGARMSFLDHLEELRKRIVRSLLAILVGFVIAFGVLLDTFLVRSVLVPALVFDIGPKVWWPSTLSKAHERRGREFHPEDHTAEEAEAPPEPVASP